MDAEESKGQADRDRVLATFKAWRDRELALVVSRPDHMRREVPNVPDYTSGPRSLDEAVGTLLEASEVVARVYYDEDEVHRKQKEQQREKELQREKAAKSTAAAAAGGGGGGKQAATKEELHHARGQPAAAAAVPPPPSAAVAAAPVVMVPPFAVALGITLQQHIQVQLRIQQIIAQTAQAGGPKLTPAQIETLYRTSIQNIVQQQQQMKKQHQQQQQQQTGSGSTTGAHRWSAMEREAFDQIVYDMGGLEAAVAAGASAAAQVHARLSEIFPSVSLAAVAERLTAITAKVVVAKKVVVVEEKKKKKQQQEEDKEAAAAEAAAAAATVVASSNGRPVRQRKRGLVAGYEDFATDFGGVAAQPARSSSSSKKPKKAPVATSEEALPQPLLLPPSLPPLTVVVPPEATDSHSHSHSLLPLPLTPPTLLTQVKFDKIRSRLEHQMNHDEQGQTLKPPEAVQFKAVKVDVEGYPHRVQVEWSPMLRGWFERAVRVLQANNCAVTPVAIRDLMGVPELSRTNISSFLQKWRQGR